MLLKRVYCRTMSQNAESLLTVDGSRYEGGGQVLRIAVALAVILRRKTKIEKIRAGRKTPGLGNQHLAGLHLVEKLCGGKFVDGSGAPIKVGSTDIVIDPARFKSQSEREFVADCGSAGSTALMAQIALPIAIWMRNAISIKLVGGTDADFAPPIDIQIEVSRKLILNKIVVIRLRNVV